MSLLSPPGSDNEFVFKRVEEKTEEDMALEREEDERDVVLAHKGWRRRHTRR